MNIYYINEKDNTIKKGANMITNQVIFSCINEVKSISKLEFSVADTMGNTIAKTDGATDCDKKLILNFAQSDADTQEVTGKLLFKVLEDRQVGYILIAEGSEDKFLVGKLLVSQLQNLIVAYRDRVDKNSFFQNLLLDNLLLVDIYNRAQKLRIDVVAKRCVFVIEIQGDKSMASMETVKELFYPNSGDYVTSVDEEHIIVIKSMSEREGYEDLKDISRMLVDTLEAEIMTNVRVAYGTIVNEIKGLSKSYKEAIMALDVGKIFYAGRNTVAYNTLGIGRLIYQLPVNLCDMFINEVFGDKSIDDIDEEMQLTINKFFENSLNVSETSRQLYIHRNTLVYRIEKLQKDVGLDIRVFDDALTLKIAMMVSSYMKYKKNHED